jgi:hypothetical protein
VPLLLRLGAEPSDRLGDHVGHRRGHRRGAVGGGELHQGERVRDRPGPGPTVRLRDVHREQPELAQAADQVGREPAEPIVLGGDGRDPLAREPARRVLDGALDVVREELHARAAI